LLLVIQSGKLLLHSTTNLLKTTTTIMTTILEKLTRSYALLFAIVISIPSILRIVEAI